MIVEQILTLLTLIFLQAVLGIDNLLYIALESKNAPVEKARRVRYIGIGIAIVMRIGMLFLFLALLEAFKKPFIELHGNGIVEGDFSLHGIIVFLGGGFIIYTAIKEIWHMMSIKIEDALNAKPKENQSITKVILMIVLMNLIFSVDSILSVIAMTETLWIMVTALLAGGLLMLWLAEKFSTFLEKHKKFEVLGLFLLLLVGAMLISEAAHLSHMHLFGIEINEIGKGTFYLLIIVLVVVDIIQTKYQQNLKKIKGK